jgi:hypothetical protein
MRKVFSRSVQNFLKYKSTLIYRHRIAVPFIEMLGLRIEYIISKETVLLSETRSQGYLPFSFSKKSYLYC